MRIFFFGVYSDHVGVTGIDCGDADSTWSYYYFSSARRSDYNSAIAYVSSQAFIAQSRKTDCDYYPIIYLEYVNGENAFAYTRSLAENVEAEAVNEKRIFFNRVVQAALSLWDWIRGKIRDTNNVVTLFCPIDLEIELECRI